MQDEDNPVKDILYECLEKTSESELQNIVLQEKISEFIKNTIQECYPKVLKLDGNSDQNVSVLATGLLHYVLTNSLIPSQRKIDYEKTQLDIIIPDLKTLITKPENSLIIQFVDNVKEMDGQIQQLVKIQPNNANIWLVTNHKINTKQKIFQINDDSFFALIDEIKKFLASKKQTQFKIFKVD